MRLLTCILSKSKHGRRCSWWLRGVRLRRGEMAKTFVGGLIERRSNDEDDGVEDEPLPVVKGLSHEIRMFSIPLPSSGVLERCCTDGGGCCGLFLFKCWWFNSKWPRCGFNASSGGVVRKLTGANMLWWWWYADSRNFAT